MPHGENQIKRSNSIHARSHPLPLLLYLEWVLLAVALLAEFLPAPSPRWRFHFPTVVFTSVITFGLMGLRLPTQKLANKVGFTILEIGLLLVASIAGIRGLRLFPVLYIVLVIRSCLMFGLAGRLVVTAAAYALFLSVLARRLFLLSQRVPAGIEPYRSLNSFAFSSALLLGLVMVFVLLLVNALLAERQSREELSNANDRLRQYALRVENLAMAQERNRIARDIHDSLGHTLTALNLQLEGAIRLGQINPTQSQAFLQEAKRLGSTALQEVRQSVSALRSDPLQQQSLETAVEELVQNFQRTAGVLPGLTMKLTAPLAHGLKLTAYRIVQEALTNIYKHAAATEVKIDLYNTDGELHLAIEDNGRGFDPAQNQTGFGLQGMQERTLALKGKLTIASQPGQGCRITATLPLREI